MTYNKNRFRHSFARSELSLSHQNLTKKSVQGGGILFIGQLLSFIIMTGLTIVLARLLTPTDYGLIAIVIPITIFFNIFKDMGFTISIIQQPKITNLELSTLFWSNIVLGVVFSLLFSLFAPFIADFYNDDRLTYIMFFTSLSFVISSISVVHSSILKRQMKFYELTIINIFSAFFSAFFAILIAYLGFGYWALVTNILMNNVLSTFLFIYILRWLPRRRGSLKALHSHFHFGKNIMMSDIINYLARNMDNFIVGKIYSITQLGLYSKAYQLMGLPIQRIRNPIMNIALPALSALRNNENDYIKYYLNVITILNLLTIPLMSFLLINSKEIIYMMLGEQWIQASSYFSLLVYAAMIQPVYGTLGLILISLGKSKKYFLWSLNNMLIISLSFFIGSHFDILGFILGYVFANYLSLVLLTSYALKDTPVKPLQFYAPLIIIWFYFVPLSSTIIYILPTYLDIPESSFFIIKNFLFVAILFLFFLIFPTYKQKLLRIKHYLKHHK